MTDYARGVTKTVAIARETTFGVKSPAAGQLVRRTSSDLNLNVQEIQSQEILPSQQVRDSRQGPRQVQGTLGGQLSAGSYKDLFEGIMRASFAANPGGNVTNLTDTSSTIDGNGNLILTSASANFPSHFHIGDVVRLSGLTGGAVADNGQNLRILGYSSTLVALGPPAAVATWSTGQTDSLSHPGKRLTIPATNQADYSYSLEHWYADVGRSELFTGVKVTQLAINVPASGFVTIQASFTGQQMVETGAQAFPSAAAASTTTGLTATFGEVCYKGTQLSYITSMSLQIATQVGADPTVGSNLVPQIFPGTVSIRGSITCLMTTDTLTADFLNEAEVSLSLLLTASPAAGAEFMSIHLPRVKLTSSTKNDSDRAITRSYSFVALENTGTVGGADLSSILVQDSSL